MKNKEINQKGFFGWKFNKNLTKISNLILIIMLLVYVGLFITVVSLIKSKEVDTLIIPDYEHVFYNEEITSHFAIIPQRSYLSDGTETMSYRTIFYNQGRYINATDPGYRISSFVAKAGITTDINDEEIDDMYYFTQQDNSQTSASHNLTISNSKGNVNPTTMYSRIRYRSAAEEKVASFYEDIQLMPTEEDKTRFDSVYNEKIKPINNQFEQKTPDSEEETKLLKSSYILNISDVNGNKKGIAQIFANRNDDPSSPKYNTTFRVEMVDKNTKYHIDCQTWIINKQGEYLPYFGVYGFTSDHDKYNSGSYSLYDETKAEYLCIKVTTYFEDNTSTICYFKQDISKLETITSNYSIELNGITSYYINEYLNIK